MERFDLHLERTLNSPRERIYRAFTEPKLPTASLDQLENLLAMG